MESKFWSCESELVSSLYDEEDVFDDSALAANNLEVFHELQKQWPGFFQVMGDEWEVGRKFGEGAQAQIFEAEWKSPNGTKVKWVLKIVKHGFSLQDVQNWFPKGMLTNVGSNGRYSNRHSCSIYGGMMLQDGRLAILMEQYWGDLRRLIDLIMQLNNNQGLPFPDMSMVIQIILDIALGMQALHEDGIVHRDLKSANVLIRPQGDNYDPIHGGKFICHVADFEVSNGVVGSGFWRAPEILLAIKNRSTPQHPNMFTEKSDVYSFAMTCYEILTGRIPFEGYPPFDTIDHIVRDCRRPEIPESIDPWVKELLEVCWHHDPVQRPSFEKIVDTLQARSRDGREPDILAPRSSTWEELNDPRVQRDQDRSMVPEIFPILIEMLVAALQCCEEEVGKMKRCKGRIGMFKFQCAHLVTCLSSDADKIFCQFQQVRQILKEPVIMNAHGQRLKLKYWFTCIAFAIHSLVDLTRNLQIVVEMLAECGEEDWWKTALKYSTMPPHPEIPRWSMFGLALQQCQWSMDIAHLAVEEISELAIGSNESWISNNREFQWCEERQRVVFQNTKELWQSWGCCNIGGTR